MAKVVKVEGLKKLNKNLKKVVPTMRRALAAAIYQEEHILIGKAVKRTPVDTGALRRSHYAAPPMVSARGDLHGEVGFGVAYALPVHERVEVFHETGGALFLKSAFDETMQGYERRLADRTDKNYKLGLGVDAIPATAPKKPIIEKEGGK